MVRRSGAVLALAVALAGAGAPAALGSASGVVVGQVYGGGGNSGATFNADYVELFNAGSAPVALDGWSLQYASATGTGAFGATAGQLTELAGTLPPGRRLLVAESGGATGAALPAPDVTDATPINLSGSAGKVALVRQTASLGCNGGSLACSPAQAAAIEDLVGYGGANFFEGSGPAPALSSSTAAVRGRGGCADTDDNAADFTAGTPAPGNSATPAATCDAPALVSSDPANGATAVPYDATITVTFSKPVAPDFALECSSTGAHELSVSGGPTSYVLDPVTDLGPGETCTVTLPTGSIRFTTLLAPTAIHDVQGAGHRSPLERQQVRVQGVVTATRSTGFWLQSTAPDADPATSEGVFVFTGGAPGVDPGDAADVTGTVQEYRPGATGLTITEISGRPSVTVTSTGNPLPAPQLIGPGGRTPSSTIIEDDATDVETDGLFDPEQDGIDFYESLEGMRVEVDGATATGPTKDFGSNREIAVVPPGASVRTPRGGIVVRPDDFNPERVILNDALDGPTLPAVDVGDRFPGATVGVMDYSFSNFKLEATTLPAVDRGGLQREVTDTAKPGELAFATFNVENLDPGDPQSKFDRLAGLIVDNLRAPDVISVEEVQDDDGATNSGTVDATTTLDQLVAAITAAHGPAYAYSEIDPVDGQDGGEPGGNIRVAFLYRTDRGLSFTPRAGGDATTPVSVQDGPSLSFNPGRIQPGDPAWRSSRKPLAGEFEFGGRKLFVVANHWNSKGGDEPLYGRHQPPTLASEVQRTQQAQLVHDFVASLLAKDASARVVVLGDLNDFPFSKPLQTLTGSPSVLEDLITRLPVGEQYSYVFDGNAQDLDHVLVTPAMSGDVRSIDAVHVNAEFADQASDHDPLVARVCEDTVAPTLSVALSPDHIWPPNHRLVDVTASVSASDAIDPSPSVSLVGVTGGREGDVVVDGERSFRLRAVIGNRYTVTYRAADACGNAVMRSASVEVAR